MCPVSAPVYGSACPRHSAAGTARGVRNQTPGHRNAAIYSRGRRLPQSARSINGANDLARSERRPFPRTYRCNCDLGLSTFAVLETLLRLYVTILAARIQVLKTGGRTLTPPEIPAILATKPGRSPEGSRLGAERMVRLHKKMKSRSTSSSRSSGRLSPLK